jgi:hypothetical protein
LSGKPWKCCTRNCSRQGLQKTPTIAYELISGVHGESF